MNAWHEHFAWLPVRYWYRGRRKTVWLGWVRRRQQADGTWEFSQTERWRY